MTSSHREMIGFLGLVALFSCFCLGAAGQDEQKKISIEGFPCGKKNLKMHTLLGVDQPLKYICENDEVDLDPNGHTFKMAFKKNECPFSEGCDDISQTVTNTKTPIVKHMRHFDKIIFIKYTVWVDDHKPIDPIIIGGGGHGWGDPDDPAFRKSK